MKTENAKDLLKQILNTDLTLQYREKLIIEYAESKCTEQRQFCANYYIIRKANEKCNDTISFEDIMNAPKPDFK